MDAGNPILCPHCGNESGYNKCSDKLYLRHKCRKCKFMFFPHNIANCIEDQYISDLKRTSKAIPGKHAIRRFLQRIEDVEPSRAKSKIIFMWDRGFHLLELSHVPRRIVAKYYYDEDSVRGKFVILIASAKSRRIITIYKPRRAQIIKFGLQKHSIVDNS
jgi:hypothetical protein